MAKIGEIWISLGLATASFTTNLNKAKNLAFGSAKEMERSFRIIGAAVASAGVAMGVAFAHMVKSQISYAASLHDLSQKTKVSVETLSLLDFVAKKSGVDLQSVATALQKLQRSAVDAALGNRELSQWFQRLGMDVRDAGGNIKSGEQLFTELSMRVRELGMDSRNASFLVVAAAKVMGKAGAEQLPVLQEDLQKAREEFQRLGGEVSTKTAAAADRLEEGFLRLRAAARGVALGVVDELVPALNQVIDRSNQGVPAIERWSKAVGSWVIRWHTIGTVGPLGPLLDLMKELEKTELPKALQPPGLPKDWLALSGVKPALNFDEPAAAAVKKHAEAIQGIIGKLREEIATFGMSGVAVNVYKAALEGASPAQQQLIHKLGITVQQLEFMQKKLSDVAVVPTFQMPAGAQELEATIEEMALQMGDFAKNTEGAVEAMGRLGVVVPEVLRPMADQLPEIRATMRGFAEQSLLAFESWIVGGGSFRGVLQGILQDLARMILQLTVIQPLMRSILGAGKGGGGGGLFGFLGSLFGGLFGGGAGGLTGGAHHTFAHGGIPPVGQVSIVGEHGPEPILPLTPVRILPHEALSRFAAGGAGGVTIINNIDNRGADLGTTAKTAMLVNKLAMKQFAELMHERGLRTA